METEEGKAAWQKRMVLTSNCPAEVCTVFIFERKRSLDVASAMASSEREFLAYFIVLLLFLSFEFTWKTCDFPH